MTRFRHAAGLAVLLALALFSTGCIWAFPRYDAGGTSYNTAETTIALANAQSLHETWRTNPLGIFRSEPIVSPSTMFVATFGPSAPRLEAYDAAGQTGCTGTPATCQPIWTAPLDRYAQPYLNGNTIFVAGAAFDATGTTGCGGSPKVCTPLFTTSSSFIYGTIVDNLLYATPVFTGANVLAVYDATGTNGCTGSPKVCSPLRTYRVPCGAGETCQALEPVADGNRVFAGIGVNDGTNFTGRVASFDRTGATGCSGTPVICTPQWTRTIGSPWNLAASGGRVYTAASVTNLTDTPPPSFKFYMLSATDGSTLGSTPAGTTAETVVAVGGGLVHLARGQVVETYDATCTGTCTQLRFYGASGAPLYPIVANGLLYSGNQSALKLYDVSGVANCGGTPIPGCAPIANIRLPVDMRLSAVVNGRVYLNGDNDQRIRVFGL